MSDRVKKKEKKRKPEFVEVVTCADTLEICKPHKKYAYEAKYRTTMDWTENIDWEIKIKSGSCSSFV